eukprot:GEZU01044159.1.p1 GENE.GEZU01044159.1~~GEZU01044159.1.p1  ORF type:complete len:117 (-),score=40.51 GEZU01044159.1:236-586(-)
MSSPEDHHEEQHEEQHGDTKVKKVRRMKASEEELDAAQVPLHLRDFCSHYLIPLNKCRRENYYLPWKCEEEKLLYERCQYREYLRRVRKMERLRKKIMKEKILEEERAAQQPAPQQ